MSEKVKVTREIANAIEFGIKHHDKDDIVRAHTNVKDWRLVGEMKPLREMPLDRLIKALYIGYEVEPEFKVGDWVASKLSGEIRQITEIKSKEITPKRIVSDAIIDYPESLRHATPSEIAEEKERRFFAKHGREPWGLRNGDVLSDNKFKVPLIVKRICNTREVYFTDGEWDDLKRIKAHCKVIAFAESRLDVKTNE